MSPQTDSTDDKAFKGEDSVDRSALSEGEDVVEGPRRKQPPVKDEELIHPNDRNYTVCDCPQGMREYHEMMREAIINWKKAVKRKQEEDEEKAKKRKM